MCRAVDFRTRVLRIIDRNRARIHLRSLTVLKALVILNQNIVEHIARNRTQISCTDKALCRHIGRHPASGIKGVHLVLLRRIIPRSSGRSKIRPAAVTETKVTVVHHIACQICRCREGLPLRRIGCCGLIGIGIGKICKGIAICLLPLGHPIASPCAIRIGRQYRAVARTCSATGCVHRCDSGAAPVTARICQRIALLTGKLAADQSIVTVIRLIESRTIARIEDDFCGVTVVSRINRQRRGCHGKYHDSRHRRGDPRLEIMSQSHLIPPQ